MKKFDFDLVVIGSGAAGSEAALVGARRGLKVALVEGEQWGGKSLEEEVVYDFMNDVANLYTGAVRGARFGLSSSSLRYNYPTIVNWREAIKRKRGVGSKKLFQEAGVECFKGFGHFLTPFELAVGRMGRISGKNFVIATGTKNNSGGISGVEDIGVLLPLELLNLDKLPKVVLVVGGGATGCEIAEYLAKMGVKVLILESQKQLLPEEDQEVGEIVERKLVKDLGVKVLLESKVVAIEKDQQARKVVFVNLGKEKSVKVEQVVLATGRTSRASELGLENAGVSYSEQGIETNENGQTTMKHIYAAGDVRSGSKNSSREKARYEGTVVVNNIFVKRRKIVLGEEGLIRRINLGVGVASVGLSEKACIRSKRKYHQATARSSEVEMGIETRAGLVKILADNEKKIIGAMIVSPEAETMVGELNLAIKAGVRVRELAEIPRRGGSWGELVGLALRKLL